MSVQRATSQEQPTAKAVIDLTASLPNAGKVEVLVHLLRAIDNIDLETLPKEVCARLFQKLPAASNGGQAIDISPSRKLRPQEQFKFETFDAGCDRGVRFVQPKGMSLRTMMELINDDSQDQFGQNAIYEDVLFEDSGIDIPATADMVHEFIPVVKGSKRSGYGDLKRYLESKDMSMTDRPLITIAAGLFRLVNGFPKNRANIGTKKDKGDLLEGNIVRALSGVLASCPYGLSGRFWFGDLAFGSVVAAGSPNQKS